MHLRVEKGKGVQKGVEGGGGGVHNRHLILFPQGLKACETLAGVVERRGGEGGQRHARSWSPLLCAKNLCLLCPFWLLFEGQCTHQPCKCEESRKAITMLTQTMLMVVVTTAVLTTVMTAWPAVAARSV